MNLIVDVGNTLVKAAVFQKDRLQKVEAFEKKLFEKKIQYFFEKFPQIEYSILSSVQNHPKHWENILQQHSNYLQLSSSTPVSFINNYASPKTLGIDRIALMEAASKKYNSKNVLVIDAGTCITYDFLNNKNEYLGGVISPGLHMRARAMSEFTSKLPFVEVKNFEHSILGNNTQQCLEIGVVKAAALEIDGFINEYRETFQDLTVILTGGDSQILSNNVKNSIFATSNFLLEGLNQILEFNKS